MAKLDPKLVKKIVHSKLIACSTEVGVKNADKVSKELLISAFLDAVEQLPEGDPKMTANIVNMYNEIVKTLGLDQPEGDPEPAAETPAEPTPEPVPEPVPEPEPPPPPVARRVGRPATPAPSAPAPAAPRPAAAAPAAPKPPKEPKEKAARKGPAPKLFNRWTSLGDTLLTLKTGTMEELIAAANQNYVDKGGKDNPKESATVVKCSVSVLEKMGIVTVTNGSFTVN